MEIRIDEMKSFTKYNDRNIMILVSHTGHTFVGLPAMSIEDLIQLKKAIRKFVKTKKQKTK